MLNVIYLPTHVGCIVLFCLNPGWQTQEYDPLSLRHLPGPHLSGASWHSFMSFQIRTKIRKDEISEWLLIYYILLGRIFTAAQRERAQEDFKVLFNVAPYLQATMCDFVYYINIVLTRKSQLNSQFTFQKEKALLFIRGEIGRVTFSSLFAISSTREKLRFPQWWKSISSKCSSLYNKAIKFLRCLKGIKFMFSLQFAVSLSYLYIFHLFLWILSYTRTSRFHSRDLCISSPRNTGILFVVQNSSYWSLQGK